MSKSFLEVDGLSKVYPDGEGGLLTVYEDIKFSLEKGEFVCIIGHSGCGKSTILNVLAGLDEATSGNIVMNGKEVVGPSLDRGVVFQNYSLLPWKTTLNNIVFAVQARWPTWSKEKVREHSERYLKMVGLDHALQRKPSQLSGGMRQRVSIARAFATQPELLLLDEPFGALDALTRGVIQDELVKIWEETRQTVFMITHDVDEAILLSDRIFLMSNGPNARIAESVKVDLPHPRARSTIFQNPNYHKTRDYLVDYLINRSESALPGPDGTPRVVEPAKGADGSEGGTNDSNSTAKAVNA
ncbi:ABC transporter ATP-binding protein [Marinobacter confluentis]|uniref:ABC transporter ATP-binding protein n=1 Tax=Marinobacter confluentis TaxID=1697557 RepID=UPI001CDA5238|nr:ABC transporter ATP-binding protein [Marinobacter confluentis]